MSRTLHNDDIIHAETQNPDKILSYNGTKGEVDVVDHLYAKYNSTRTSRSWPIVLFYVRLNVSTLTGQVIHTANNQNSKL